VFCHRAQKVNVVAYRCVKSLYRTTHSPMDWHLCGMIAIGSTLKAGRQQLQPLLRSRRIAQAGNVCIAS